MTLCNEWSLVKHLPNQRLVKPLPCRSWYCKDCAPVRKRQLMAKAASGNPNRFITLTVNPNYGASPEDRLYKLAEAWRLCVKRLRRKHPELEVEYLAVVEKTKAGEPHLHILFRGPFVPQRWLSSVMAELIDSPIVDIRRVKHLNHVVRYVAKYVAKEPGKFGTCKRYWASQRYDADREAPPSATAEGSVKWAVDKRPLRLIIEEWTHTGWTGRRGRGAELVFFESSYVLRADRPP